MKIKAFFKNIIYWFVIVFARQRPLNRAAILMYHSVSDKEALYAISPKKFAWQMAYLKKNNFNVISLSSLVEMLQNKQIIPPKSVAITFDDGYEDNYLTAWPILKKYNFPASIFLTVNRLNKIYKSQSQNVSFQMLNWPQIQEMRDFGLIDFGPHSLNHPKLGQLENSEAEKEVIESAKIIEEKLDKKCRIFCYPYGYYNQDTIEILKNNGFEAALTVKQGFASAESDGNLFELPRNFPHFYCGRYEFRAIIGEVFKLL